MKRTQKNIIKNPNLYELIKKDFKKKIKQIQNSTKRVKKEIFIQYVANCIAIINKAIKKSLNIKPAELRQIEKKRNAILLRDFDNVLEYENIFEQLFQIYYKTNVLQTNKYIYETILNSVEDVFSILNSVENKKENKFLIYKSVMLIVLYLCIPAFCLQYKQFNQTNLLQIEYLTIKKNLTIFLKNTNFFLLYESLTEIKTKYRKIKKIMYFIMNCSDKKNIITSKI